MFCSLNMLLKEIFQLQVTPIDVEKVAKGWCNVVCGLHLLQQRMA